MRIQTFNTGRTYTDHGQRIAFTQIDNHCIFVDVDRGLDGHFEVDFFGIGDPATQAMVMSRYDHDHIGEPRLVKIEGVDMYAVLRELEAAAKAHGVLLPAVKDHYDARCVHCGHPLSGEVNRTSRDKEAYEQHCNACQQFTYYTLGR